MAENLPLILSCIAVGIAVGVFVMYRLSHSKSVDARGEAIKAIHAAVSLVAKMPTQDEVIADATSRKAAEAAALAALKSRIDAL